MVQNAGVHNMEAETGRASNRHGVGVGWGTVEASYTQHGVTWHLPPRSTP
jgi:hypothetical protein